MNVQTKVTGKAMSMPGGLALGGVVSLFVTLLAAAILAKLMELERIPENSIGYGIMILLVLASFSGAAFSAWQIKRRRLIVCVLSGVVYMASLLAATALFFGGQYSSVGVTALMVLCGVGLAALAGTQRNKAGKKRKKPMYHR